MGDSIKVLMAGSTINVKGGMTTVVNTFLNHHFSQKIQLSYVPSHSEKGRLFNSLYFLNSLAVFIYHLLFKNPDVVHLHMSDKGSFIRKYILFKVAQIMGRPVIIHAHGGDFHTFYARLPEVVKGWVHDMLRNADKVIALGNNWRRILMEIEPEADVLVLMNPVTLPEYQSALAKNNFTILFLAVMNESKGILDLIHAAEKVRDAKVSGGNSLLFEIAGDGEMLQEAKNLVKQKNLDEAFRFHGWVDCEKKYKLLRNADLFVLPSYFEGLPMSILEAVSYGLPVIATDVGSIDEAVAEGENGFLIKPGDIELLTEYILWMIDNAPNEQMRHVSRRIAEEKFDENVYFQKMEELYVDCLRNNQIQYDRKSS